jgi:hypothetical protein
VLKQIVLVFVCLVLGLLHLCLLHLCLFWTHLWLYETNFRYHWHCQKRVWKRRPLDACLYRASFASHVVVDLLKL